MKFRPVHLVIYTVAWFVGKWIAGYSEPFFIGFLSGGLAVCGAWILSESKE